VYRPLRSIGRRRKEAGRCWIWQLSAGRSSLSNVDIKFTRSFGNSVLDGALESERTNSTPPNRNTIPNKLTYVTHYALDMAYVNPPGNTETHKKFKRRLYKAYSHWRTPNEDSKKCESPRNTRQSLDTRMDHTTHSLDT
jgi:hypothetical protein